MPSAGEDEDDERAAPAGLLRQLERWAGSGCASCARPLCGHVVLVNVALGLQDAPRCLDCLAIALGRVAGELRDQVGEYLQHRDCYRQAWAVACDREALPRSKHPACLWPGGAPAAVALPPAVEAAPGGEAVPVAATWDAGDMGCGDLVLALRTRLRALPPGAVLRVTARDPAAPHDLPAWCRLTGHRLLRADHPFYDIQRKEP